jgi:HK97 family phage portal protein
MKLFKRSKKKLTKKSESCQFSGFYSALMGQGNYKLADHQSLSYYDQVAPLSTAIDWLGEEAYTVDPVIYDKSKDEYIDDHAVIMLLNNPSAYQSKYDFFIRLYNTYNLSGNAYIVATGLKEPIELSVVSPENINIIMGTDGYPQTYQISSARQNIDFLRKEINGKFRYFTQDATKELYHIKAFNPMYAADILHGASKLNSLFYQIEQYIELSIHNLALLKNGGRLTGMLLVKGAMTDENFTHLERQLNNHLSGAENAGRMAVLTGDEMKYQELGKSNRDMDFMSLDKKLSETIYKRFRIPLPLIEQDRATHANMDSSKLNLYDNAVLPLVKHMYHELTTFLMYRYKNSESMIITYNINSITALKGRTIEYAKAKSEVGAFTINEIRKDLGSSDAVDGDDIYAPNNLVPIASVDE